MSQARETYTPGYTPNAALIADYLAQQLDSNGSAESAAVLRDWAEEPDARFAQAWFEPIGYKDYAMPVLRHCRGGIGLLMERNQ